MSYWCCLTGSAHTLVKQVVLEQRGSLVSVLCGCVLAAEQGAADGCNLEGDDCTARCGAQVGKAALAGFPIFSTHQCCNAVSIALNWTSSPEAGMTETV
jgi:hypothetical protein